MRSKGLQLLLSTILVLCWLRCGHSARILAIEPVPGKSHMAVFSALTDELLRRGHELVMVSAFPSSEPHVNLTDIDIMPTVREHAPSDVNDQMYQLGEWHSLVIPLALWEMGVMTSDVVLHIPEVRALLQDKRGFDLVIVEAFMNEAVYGFADYFQAPLVIVCPFSGFHWMNYGPGNPIPFSYVPNSMMAFSDHMSLSERVINTLYTLIWDLGHQLYYLPKQEAIRQEIFGPGKSVWELQNTVSLTLLNSHVSLHYPRPLVPSVVEVGGLHVDRTVKKLPTDIQKFLDEAPEGAIYFSMGSNLRSDQMPAERRDAFMATFKELPQRVLWKWESDSLPGQPSNVKLGKWLPQQDILAHPKVRLFITHGGLLSAQEAAFHGVPLVGIPVYGDQGLNMRKAEKSGFGLMLSLKNVTKESALWAINKVLHDPSYRRQAERRMAVYRDQPETPLERAVFWTEYVLRHQGAPHLRSAATHLAWYQLYLLDVAALVLGLLLVIVLVLKTLVTRLCLKTVPAPESAKKRQ